MEKIKTFFIPTTKRLPVVVVCPGGGYTHLSDREAIPVARCFNELGFHSIVLYYSLAPAKFPAALLDLCDAIHYLRQNAEKFNIDENNVIVCGFSAGGHLAGSLAVFWNSSFLKEKINYSAEEIKPNVVLLSYPVISAGEFAHRYSFCALMNGDINEENYDSKKYDCVSLEKQVNSDVPPVFIWHTVSDDAVPVENSMLFAEALKKQNIPFALHLFPKGRHGISLATEETSREDGLDVVPECQVWPKLFKQFFTELINK